MVYEFKVTHAKSGKTLANISTLSPQSTIQDVKKAYNKINSKYYTDRQSFRLEPRGKMLKDGETLESLGVKHHGELFFKDLGPQLGWTTVFLTEYAGPLVIYLIFYTRPAIIYGAEAVTQPRALVVNIAAACWTFHYAKRLFETVFIHRFSHATMPIMNIFKNSSYYWGFAAFVSYFVNHPLYTPPAYGDAQIYGGLAAFIFGELGNLSIHVALRNLRPADLDGVISLRIDNHMSRETLAFKLLGEENGWPPIPNVLVCNGSKVRKIPRATWNPFTWLFSLVTCPNYTYEFVVWIGFSVMTQCLPAAFFTVAGFYQMTVWAHGKHRNYKREFKDYPRGRKPIIPFLI